MKMKRVSRQILSFTVVLAMLILALFTGCAGQGSQSSQSSQTTSSSGTTEILAEADIPAGESSQLENSAKLNLDNRLAYPRYQTVVSLYAANGPGQPKDQKVSNLYATGGNVQISGPQLASVTAPFTFLNPAEGEVLYVNTPYEITWTSRLADRMPKLNILLSTDGGNTFEEIVTQMDYASSCSIYVLNRPSSRCYFRIDAYIGETVYSVTSPQFSIARKPAPTPAPTLSPAPSPSPTPSPSPSPTPTVMPTPTPAPDLSYSKTTVPFIDQNGDATRWFFIDLQTTKAVKIIWQLSKSPFTGLATSDYLNPPGLIASGELPVQGDEFAVDFNAIYQSLQANHASERTSIQSNYVPIAATNKGVEFSVPAKQILLEQLQYALYMRAIALDTQGNCIGDPGEGIELTYGRQAIDFSPDRSAILQQAIGGVQTWVRPLAGLSGAAYEHLVDKGLAARPTDQAYDFEFRSTPEGTVSVELQVATSPFASGAAAIENPAGLVHRVTWGPEFSYPPNAFTTSIRFADFAPKVEELGPDPIKYFVRMIFYRPSKVTPGTLYPTVSEVQPVYYAKSFVSDYIDKLSAMATQPTNQVIVDSDIPMTKFLRYVPVQWEHPDCNHYFEVTRRILADEVCFSLTNNATGETLKPLSAERFTNPALTTEQYQAKVDRMLPVGATFHLTVTQGLWNEFWSLLSDIYESVRKAYDDLKYSIVDFLVKYVPDDDLRSLLRGVVETVLTTGLAMIGIPPTLPNFQALAGEGFEYCLEVAIEEACKTAGVPENKISQTIRDQIAGELRSQMESMTRMSQVNPLDVDFLKPSTKHHYRPAYVEVSVANFSDDPSPAGTLKISYYPVKTNFMNIYKSKSLPIPSLDPGQNMIIRVYLKEDIPEAYSSGKGDYDIFYWGNGGDCIFTLKAIYNLPDVRQAAEEQNLTGQTGPFVTNEYVYDHDPVYEYTMTWVPSEYQMVEDESVNFGDFYEK